MATRYYVIAGVIGMIGGSRVVLVERGVAKQADTTPRPSSPRRPSIDSTEFGSITIGGRLYEHDVLIRLDGKIVKRQKSLSKLTTGDAHIISLDEAKHVYEQGATPDPWLRPGWHGQAVG